MTRAKKLLLVLLGLVLLSQLPFAYRRYRLRKLKQQIERNEVKAVDSGDPFTEYKGAMHVHSFLGGHSSGTFQEIIAAANQTGLQFVIMTEHPAKEIDTSALTLQGMKGGVLFINGNEVSSASGDRLLLVPGEASLAQADQSAINNLATTAHARNALAIAAYPDEFKSWDAGFDGVEVYNVFTNAKEYNKVVAFFDGLWSYSSYRDLLFANFYQRPTAALQKWDSLLATRRVVATAGTDAHSNIGVSLNDASGKQLYGIKVDPYQTSFALVKMHVLLPRDKNLDAQNLLDAIRAGHCYIGFDVFGDVSNFRFTATNGSMTAIQGDEITLTDNTSLKVWLTAPRRVVIFRNGATFFDEAGVQMKEVKITERGVYRVEIYNPGLGKPFSEQPLIISNPIYVR
ncbi:MAG TPA: hypothetical protein VI306_11855 [Pyrinomonadaceae bacterium]